MKKDIWFILLIVLAGSIYFFLKNKAPEKAVSEIQFYIGGELKDLNHFKGNKLLVHYYASWCGPCLQEMPQLVAAQGFLEENGIQVVFLTDDNNSEIEQVRKGKEVPYPIYKLSNSLKTTGIRSIPTTYLYSAEGKQVYSYSGQISWDTDEGKKLILGNL